MRINSSGYVGIGTTNPSTTLHVHYTANDGTEGLKLGSAGVASA